MCDPAGDRPTAADAGATGAAQCEDLRDPQFVGDLSSVAHEGRSTRVLAVVAEMGSPTSVDEVAGVTGLTRAETLHILAALVQAGVAVYTPTPAPTPPDGVWWTAEQIAS